ncbi:MAG: flagellar basal body P-ring formation chaperone FlgA [Spongiibacteraceae bacterium]
MMVRSFLRICHLTAALVCATAAFADGAVNATKADPRSQITGFLDKYARDLVTRLGEGARVEYDRNAATANLETRSCAAPLNIGTNNQQTLGRVTLQVACGSEWSIYIPVDLDIYRAVVVATKPLATGSVITASDVEMATFDVSQLAGTYLTTANEAIGMGVKRPISTGRPLVAQQLEQPLLIRRGEGVVISAESGELAVKMSGTALTDGRRGELIRIKNQTSARVVDAKVIGPGQVSVPM